MKNFANIEVIDIQPDTRNAVIVTLRPPAEFAEDFRYIQGQYLTFRKEFDGEEIRRSYSICSSVNDNVLRVGIKKVEGGWFSTWANEELKIGDEIEVMVPQGRFFSPLELKKQKDYLMFAIGSGITPILSILTTVLEAEPLSRVTLVYGNRAGNTIMFKEALNDLKNTYMKRFTLLHILSRDTGDIEMFSGRIDVKKCDQLFSSWLDPKSTDMAYICGPKEITLTISDRLQTHGLDKASIKFELFASSLPKKARKESSDAMNADKMINATVIYDGRSRQFEMPAQDMSILDAAMANDIGVPFSCQAGVCSTCSAKVIKGEVEMQVNYGLEDYEVERGLVLTCQAYPVTDNIIVDYDQH